MLHKCAITLNKITDSSGFEHCWNCWDNVTFLNAWMLLITFSKAFKESYLMLTKTQGYIYIKRRIKTSISTLQHHSLSCGCGILWYNHTHCECFLHRCHLPAFPGAAVQTVFKCRFVFSLCILTETLSVVLSVWSIISFTFETFKISSFAPTFFY